MIEVGEWGQRVGVKDSVSSVGQLCVVTCRSPPPRFHAGLGSSDQFTSDWATYFGGEDDIGGESGNDGHQVVVSFHLLEWEGEGQWKMV